MGRKALPVLAVLFGFAVIAATVGYVIVGVKNPTGANSITIALLSAIGVPVALSAIAMGYRGLRGPDAATLKTEAEAKKRAAAALEDAETAEKIKSELEAYVIVRTFRLEIERKRQELSGAVDAALEMLTELNADEVRLGEKETSLDPQTLLTLDALLQSSEIPELLDAILGGIPAFGFFSASPVFETIFRKIYGDARSRKLRRLARLVPEARAVPDERNKPGADV
jgi:hypothetical protein